MPRFPTIQATLGIAGLVLLATAAGTAHAQLQPSGVAIDPQGVLRVKLVPEENGRLTAERRRAAEASLPQELRRPSPLRKVALSRLEAELAKHAATGHGIPEEIANLAGLTRVRYVLVYPGKGKEPGEIVLAGPAEGWMLDAAGRTVGVGSGRPTVLLEDLAAAMRAFPPGQPADRTLLCSIDPTDAGLAAMQQYLRQLGRVNPAADAGQIVAGLKESLGLQDVRIDGVPPASHFAQVMVEADYRMKLIGIGLEPVPVRMRSWIELAGTASVAANALQRWYFVPDYQCVRIAEDDLAIELVGEGVKLAGADEVVLPDGRRQAADREDRASKTFTETFTKKYPQIAAARPVYAQLRSLVDLAVVAAYLQEHDGYGRVRWAATTLLDEQAYPIETHPVPTHVEPAVHAVWRGRRLLTPIGGGVMMQPRRALDAENLLADEEAAVAAVHGGSPELPEGRWWWD